MPTDNEVYKQGHPKAKCQCGKTIRFSMRHGMMRYCKRCRDKRKTRR